MLRSQNGLSANDRSVIRSELVPGTDVKVAVRVGPVGDLLLWAAARWHREVEPLRAPDGVLDAWGYAERTIRGSSTELSNHASGSALDLRARAHPLGTDPAANFTAAQVAAVRSIVRDARGCLRWGGDYVGRKDGMHIETLGTEAEVAAVLATLNGDDMQADERAALFEVRDALRAAGFGKGRLPGRALDPRFNGPDDAFGWILTAAGRAADAAAAATKASAGPPHVDYDELASALLRQLLAVPAATQPPR